MADTIYVLTVTGMHGGSCGLLIDDTLEELPGVSASRTDVGQARTTVYVDPARCAVDDVIGAIAEAGYTAQEVQP
jgi:copper chaperone CopZ